MRVLVYEQQHVGHFYRYLHYLLPRLVAVVPDVVVTITKRGLASPEFASCLAEYSNVAYEPILSDADPRDLLLERSRVYTELRRVARHVGADYVLLPSADSITWLMSVAGAVGLGGLAAGAGAEVGIHFGLGRAQAGAAGALKDFVRTTLFRASDLKRIHVLNTLFYEHLMTAAPGLRRRLTLMPHPIPAIPQLSTLESRRRLGIPEDGRYIGLIGSIDRRKAVSQLLASFVKMRRPGDRLLIVGRIDPSHRSVIDGEYRHLVANGALVLIDEFVDNERFATALTAVDVVCTPYPHFRHVSAMLLHALSARRPVVCGALGWSEAMVQRFSVGWSCDVLDPEQLAPTLATALDHSAEFVVTEAMARLLAFHSPANFAESWVTGIRSRIGAPPDDDACSWEWVNAALSADRVGRL